jgi:hypothetical protein
MSDPETPRTSDTPPPGPQGGAFADAAVRPRRSLPWEVWQFARENKKWWIIPIVVALVLIGVLMLLGTTGVGSLIYPLF